MTIAFPNVKLNEKAKGLHKAARKVISGKTSKKEIKLCVVASDFQQEVWRELLKIPFGKTTSYGEIATNLNQPVGASRAIGTAIGKNPVAFLIPCHRVIQLSGKLGGYRWGLDRKKEILLWESELVN
jgi:AraC family transcriptional regulator of adaptative response/methylated-DNA-[protein]-cysteine methyltransferase